MAERNWFTEYLDRCPLPMAVAEGRAHILRSANPAFRRLTHTLARTPAGQPAADVTPVAGRKDVLALLDQVYRTGEARRDVEVKYSRTDRAGSTWWSYTIWPVGLEPDGRAEALVIQIRDTTQAHAGRSNQREAAADMRAVNEQLLIASLHEEELATQARAAEERAVFLVNASVVLASSLDVQVTLQSLANLAVPFLGDWCIVHIAAEERDARRVAVAHRDLRKEELAQELEARFPLQPIVSGVFECGSPVLLSEISAVEPAAADADYERIRRELTARSGLAVPIIVQRRTVGVLTLIISESNRRYKEEDVPLAQALARHAALALISARRMHEVEGASKAKSHFLATMSHELRTPLTAIMGYGALLADGITGPVTEAQRRQLSRIHASATHLLGLIDEVLTLSRIEAGQAVVQREPVDVQGLLDAATAIVEPLADERHLALDVHGPASPITLETDPTRVRQILVNLLGNAVKFTEHGKITLCTHVENEVMRFVVRDTGIGISEEHLEHIFDPFWQVEQKTTRKAGGTGLGLSVSRHLARLLGGDLTVESAAGEGSTFTLAVPAGVRRRGLGRLL